MTDRHDGLEREDGWVDLEQFEVHPTVVPGGEATVATIWYTGTVVADAGAYYAPYIPLENITTTFYLADPDHPYGFSDVDDE